MLDKFLIVYLCQPSYDGLQRRDGYCYVDYWKDVTAGHELIGPKLDSYETEVKN